MLSSFQAGYRLPALANSLTACFFETQIFSLLAAWHFRSHADLAHIGPREQLSDIVRSLWPQPAASYEAQCLIGRHSCLEAVKCRRRNGAPKAK
jgi:hypothetical protein